MSDRDLRIQETIHEVPVGIDLRTQHPKAGQIRAAVRHILAEPRYANAARRIKAEINASGREDHAAELLEQLALRRAAVSQEIHS